MTNISIWSIQDKGPKRLVRSQIDLEKHLEDWIEQDPGLLDSQLTVVGRQINVEGGRLDLLGVNSVGQWVVIELKPVTIYREVIAQALDYASSIASMPFDQLKSNADRYLQGRGSSWNKLQEEMQGVVEESEEHRMVVIYVVGVGSAPGLERIIDYLGEEGGIPIKAITFEVFQSLADEKILIREITESEGSPQSESKAEAVCLRADHHGIGKAYREIYSFTMSRGLYPKAYVDAIMYAPPSNKNTCLFTAWATPVQEGKIKTWVETSAFPRFYNISLEKAEEILGPSGYRYIDPEDVPEFIARIEKVVRDV